MLLNLRDIARRGAVLEIVQHIAQLQAAKDYSADEILLGLVIAVTGFLKVVDCTPQEFSALSEELTDVVTVRGDPPPQGRN